jgi:uncharacterized phage infection (PIP) family protein YhgE
VPQCLQAAAQRDEELENLKREVKQLREERVTREEFNALKQKAEQADKRAERAEKAKEEAEKAKEEAEKANKRCAALVLFVDDDRLDCCSEHHHRLTLLGRSNPTNYSPRNNKKGEEEGTEATHLHASSPLHTPDSFFFHAGL